MDLSGNTVKMTLFKFELCELGYKCFAAVHAHAIKSCVAVSPELGSWGRVALLPSAWLNVGGLECATLADLLPWLLAWLLPCGTQVSNWILMSRQPQGVIAGQKDTASHTHTHTHTHTHSDYHYTRQGTDDVDTPISQMWHISDHMKLLCLYTLGTKRALSIT